MNGVIEVNMSFGERQSFKKKESLNRQEIGQVFKKGKRIRVKDYLGLYLHNGEAFSKLGVSLKKN